MVSAEQWWERITAPLLEDETLRGDLDDAAYQPLLDWAMAAGERCAFAVAAAANASTLAQACASQLRALLFAATRTAVDARRDELAALIGPPVFAARRVATVRQDLAAVDLGGEPSENARRLAALLTAGITAEGQA